MFQPNEQVLVNKNTDFKKFLIPLQPGAYATGSFYFLAIFRTKSAGSRHLWGEMLFNSLTPCFLRKQEGVNW